MQGSSYDRAERNFAFQKATGTASTLGPGVYEINRSSIRPANDGYAPFNSLSTRDTFLTPSDNVAAAPGPGQYDLDAFGIKPTDKGCSGIRTKAPRFREKKEEIPGPGQYNTNSTLGKSAGSAPPGRSKPQMHGEMRVRLERKVDAPSIPIPSQAYGYEEGNDGQLLRQAPPNIDSTIGPAYYNPRIQDSLITRKYKGCHWGKQKTQRSSITAHEGPGPADYNPVVENFHHDLQEKMTLHAMGVKPELHVPRLLDQVVAQSKKEHIPGPGAYNVKSFTENRAPVLNEDGVLVEHPPFGVAARRFQSRAELVPGPGAYNDPRHALTSLGKLKPMKNNPFGQTAVRFQENSDIKHLPGPGAYSAETGLAMSSLKAAWQASTRKGGFGSTATRGSLQNVSGVGTQAPGPGTYQIPDKPIGAASRYSQPMSSMFASQTRRDQNPTEMDIEDKPPPGSYNVVDSFSKSQGRRSLEPPRNDVARKRNQSFISAAPRFNGKLFTPAGFGETPGPAAYNSNVGALKHKGGKFITMGARFNSTADMTPGPGQYELSPSIANTVLKNTYNVTLNNPLVSPHLEFNPLPHLPGSSVEAK